MLSHLPGRLAALGFIVALIGSFRSSAADEKNIYTQKPDAPPIVVRGEQPKPGEAKPPSDTPKGADKKLAGGPTPLWIWGDDINKKYALRKEFAGGSTAARLKATCDNRMVVSINGQVVARSDEWQAPVEVDVQKYLKADNNVLVSEVINDGGAAGFVLKLAMTMPNGDVKYVVTDESWQAADKKDAEKWVAVKKIAKLGDAPWGEVFTKAAATPNPAAAKTGTFEVLPGFKVERLFTVPKDKLGSWVCITTDDKGRLIVSDQEKKGLCRITPPKIGSDESTRVEHLDVNITAAQGLLWAFGKLYVCANGGPGSGLYRVSSSKGDDNLDKVEKLASIRGGGEHGPHGLRLSPDGKSIYVVCGNHTQPPEKLEPRGVPKNWAEDLLLPRQWDANGHARGIMAPGGYIARTDPDGKAWELVSAGYRNPYDIAFNADGELITYDADMEWDIGTPWYRPTRVCHATAGSEFGWRSGTGKWPTYYIDSLPPLVNVGPGSPVGMEFGYGAKFPAKYQKALFCSDWTFGTIYAMHLEPDGSTYKAVKEEFLSRTPLPLTDCCVGADGALYFAIGGRGIPSELFRVYYTGSESTAPVDAHDKQGAELRALRHQLEAMQTPAGDPAKAVEFIYPNLGHSDRFIRFAARVALEHQKVSAWQDRVLAEKNTEKLISGAVALARQGDKAVRPQLLEALDRIDFAALSETNQLDLLRAYALGLMRLGGEPDKDTAAKLAKKFDPFYPAKTDALNRELSAMLIYLKSPTVIAKTLALMQAPSKPISQDQMAELLARNRGYGEPIARMLANGADQEKFYYAFVLRNVKEGWTLDQRKVYYNWIADARNKSGGASFQGFITNLEKDAFDNTTDADRLAIEAAGLRKPYKPKELPKPAGPARDWTMAELLKLGETKLANGRDFKNGQRTFAAARCIVCHRYNGEGGATGPDLTQVAGRYSVRDIAEKFIQPSKAIGDQYKASIISTKSGKVYTGRIVNETKDALIVVIDPEDSTKVVEIKKTDVEENVFSPVSLMPQDLMKPLNENEVADLLAYLLSRGDPQHPMFKKK
jgi:putative heme-binding domain-containing protein